MFRSALAIATLSVAALSAHADDTFHRTLNISNHSDVYISTGSGSIRVSQGSGDQIEITGHVHAAWQASGNVQERIAKIVGAPPIDQSGNSVHVGEPRDRSLYNNIGIDYEIRVPADAALNLRSGSGDITSDGAGRFVAAVTGSGSIRIHEAHGPAELESGSGDVELSEQPNTVASPVKAKSGSGSIRIHGLNGPLAAETGSGDIETDGHLSGMSKASSGSGSVRLHLQSDLHANLEASTGSGTVKVRTASGTNDSGHHVSMSINGGGPSLKLSSGSGDIELNAQ